jgi:hypothetical protein
MALWAKTGIRFDDPALSNTRNSGNTIERKKIAFGNVSVRYATAILQALKAE